MLDIKCNVSSMSILNRLLHSQIRRLSDVKRFATRLLIRQENVAEHSYFVALNALVIGKYLKAKGVTVDFEDLLSRALLHDIDECVTGDLLHTLKASNNKLKAEASKISQQVVLDLEDKLGIQIYEYWLCAKAEDTEGQIIMIADSLATLSFILEEIKIGNNSVQFIADSIINNELVKRIADTTIDNKELVGLIQHFNKERS